MSLVPFGGGGDISLYSQCGKVSFKLLARNLGFSNLCAAGFFAAEKSLSEATAQMQSVGERGAILVCEDARGAESKLETAVKDLGYSVELARDTEEILSCLHSQSEGSAALLEISIPNLDGIDTLKEIRRIDPQPPITAVSAAATTNDIVAAEKSDATNFLCKPAPRYDLRVAVESGLERQVSLQGPTPGHAGRSAFLICLKAEMLPWADQSKRSVSQNVFLVFSRMFG